jgi:hypothetical protein
VAEIAALVLGVVLVGGVVPVQGVVLGALASGVVLMGFGHLRGHWDCGYAWMRSGR